MSMGIGIGIGVSSPVIGVRSGAAAAFAGAYDAIPNIAAAYGMRRLLTSYTGSLLRLRRSSDSAEQDIGADGAGDLDTIAAAAFIGGGSGYIATWYDQSGNGDNIVQATEGNQPLYVASGQNDKPTLRLDGSNDNLQGAFSGVLSQPISSVVVAQLDASVVNDHAQRYIYDGENGTYRLILCKNAGSPDKWSMFAGSFVDGGNANANWNVWSALFSGASSQFWVNQASQATGNAGTSNLDGLTVGARYNTTERLWKGDIAELVIANAAWSVANRQAAETAAASYWAVY